MTATIRLPEQNQVLIVGRLTRDPDVRFTKTGQAVCRVDIAVNRRYLDNASNTWKDDVTYVPVTLWGQPAERAKDKLKKGSPVHVEGRLSMSEWVDKNGQTHKTLQVVSRRLQYLGVSADKAPESASEPLGETIDNAENIGTDLDDVPF